MEMYVTDLNMRSLVVVKVFSNLCTGAQLGMACLQRKKSLGKRTLQFC